MNIIAKTLNAIVLLPNCSNPVDEAHFGRLSYQRYGSGRVCHLCIYGSQWLPGAGAGEVKHSRPRLTFFGPQKAVPPISISSFIARCLTRPFLGEWRLNPRHYWECQARLGNGPLKKLVWWGARKIQFRWLGRNCHTWRHQQLLPPDRVRRQTGINATSCSLSS